MTTYFRIWKFGADDIPCHSEYTAFANGGAAIKAAQKRFGSLNDVEIWEGACRVWPRLGMPYHREHLEREAA